METGAGTFVASGVCGRREINRKQKNTKKPGMKIPGFYFSVNKLSGEDQYFVIQYFDNTAVNFIKLFRAAFFYFDFSFD